MIQVRVLGHPRRLFYGWVVVAAGFVNQALTIGLGFLGFGTFLVPLEQEFGWSKTTLSAARSFVQVQNGLLGPVEGFLVDRFGPRLTMGGGMFIFGLGMVLLGFIQSLWAYYAVFIIIALGASVGGFLVLMVTINNWFRRKRTLAMNLAVTGFGFGGIIVIPLLVWAQDAFGWRGAAIGAGLISWAIGIPIALLMRHSPEKYGVLPDGDPPPDPGGEQSALDAPRNDGGGGLIDFALGEAMRTPAFWSLALAMGVFSMVVGAVAVHQFAHMEQGMGLARSSAAIVVVVLSVSNIVGKVVGGVLGDRYDKRYLIAVSMAGPAIALVILAMAETLWQAIAFGTVMGLFWGVGGGSMMTSLRGEYFGRASFGKIVGISSAIALPGSIVGPMLAGAMADIQGDYQMAFIVLAAISGLGALAFLLTRPPRPPARLRGSSALQRGLPRSQEETRD